MVVVVALALICLQSSLHARVRTYCRNELESNQREKKMNLEEIAST